MLVVSDPWLQIDSGVRDQRQGIALYREFELLACRDPHVIVPKVQLVTDHTVIAVQAPQTGQSLVEFYQLSLQKRGFAVGDHQQGCISCLQPLVQALTPVLQMFCSGGFCPATCRQH